MSHIYELTRFKGLITREEHYFTDHRSFDELSTRLTQEGHIVEVYPPYTMYVNVIHDDDTGINDSGICISFIGMATGGDALAKVLNSTRIGATQ